VVPAPAASTAASRTWPEDRIACFATILIGENFTVCFQDDVQFRFTLNFGSVSRRPSV
jgi:hypothetical protein